MAGGGYSVSLRCACFLFPVGNHIQAPRLAAGSAIVRRRPSGAAGAVVSAGGGSHDKHFRGSAYHVWLILNSCLIGAYGIRRICCFKCSIANLEHNIHHDTIMAL